MSKKHLSALLFLALVSLVPSQVLAHDHVMAADVNTSINTSAAKMETRMQINAELKTKFETQKAELEAQRAKMKAEIEARKTAAEAKGDEMQAKREAMKLEIENNRATMDAKREAVRVEAEAKRAKFESMRASTTARKVEFRQDLAKKKVENTTRMILATIERLEQIAERIESRIAKVKTRGGDTAESERLVTVAKSNLAGARVAVEGFATIDLSSDTAQENFERIRAVAAEARELIRNAHENLVMAVRALGSVETTVETTSTVEVQ